MTTSNLKFLPCELREQKVLDHGYVRFVDCMGTDGSIIEAARMSTGRGFVSWAPYERCKHCESAWLTRLQDAGIRQMLVGIGCDRCAMGGAPADVMQMPRGDFGLLETLWSSGHSTPFEMCELAIEVQAPIMVFREWIRHRTQAYSEFSARYAQMPNLHYLPDLARVQKQSKTMKQGSGEALAGDTAEAFLARIEEEQTHIYNTYEQSITRDGVANEIARINTPVSRYSKMRAKTDLRNWLGFLQLRLAPTAQYEIRQYAEAVARIIAALWPKTWSLFEEHTRGAVRLSRSEAAAMQALIRHLPSSGGCPSIFDPFTSTDSDAASGLTKKQQIALAAKFGVTL